MNIVGLYPMALTKGPPLPQFFNIYWPWLKVVAAPTVIAPPPSAVAPVTPSDAVAPPPSVVVPAVPRIVIAPPPPYEKASIAPVVVTPSLYPDIPLSKVVIVQPLNPWVAPPVASVIVAAPPPVALPIYDYEILDASYNDQYATFTIRNNYLQAGYFVDSYGTPKQNPYWCFDIWLSMPSLQVIESMSTAEDDRTIYKTEVFPLTTTNNRFTVPKKGETTKISVPFNSWQVNWGKQKGYINGVKNITPTIYVQSKGAGPQYNWENVKAPPSIAIP
jgi:hypothetical protein